MALALDTSAHKNATSTAISQSITTTGGSGQIVVCIATNAASITSVTATGLTFNVRQAAFTTVDFAVGAEYVAAYTSNFSGSISVNLPTSSYTSVDIVAISGADTTSGASHPPFDSNASLPATSSNGSASGTTTNANDFVLSFCEINTATGTATSPWTIVPGSGNDFIISMYQIVSSTGTYSGASSGTINGSFVDAIVQAAAVDPGLMPQAWM